MKYPVELGPFIAASVLRGADVGRGGGVLTFPAEKMVLSISNLYNLYKSSAIY